MGGSNKVKVISARGGGEGGQSSSCQYLKIFNYLFGSDIRHFSRTSVAHPVPPVKNQVVINVQVTSPAGNNFENSHKFYFLFIRSRRVSIIHLQLNGERQL